MNNYIAQATEAIRQDIQGAIGLSVNNKTEDITIGDIFTQLLPILFVLGGFILFVMIVWGGFEMMMNATDSKAQEAGKQRITSAIIGFILLFISFWIAQLIQIIFGVRFLGS